MRNRTWPTTKLFRFIKPEVGEVRREVYGRSMGGLREVSKQDLPCWNPDKQRISHKRWEVWRFFCLHLIYQDSVGPDFLFLSRWGVTLSKPRLSLGETPTFLRGNLWILERISEKGATFLIETRHLSWTLDYPFLAKLRLLFGARSLHNGNTKLS